MSEGGFPQLQQQIANLNTAQRVGIAAAVALSSVAIYAAKNHREICGGPLDSPRHRTNCPLNFLTCAPSNDINASIADIQDRVQDTLDNAQDRVQDTIANANDAFTTIAHSAQDVMADFDAASWDPANWDLPAMPRMPQLPGFPRQMEPLLGCPHDEVLSNHPHAQTCLQCQELRRCSNQLERAYMNWTSSSPPEDDAATPLLRCPHNQRISPHATACMNCAERSYTNELERGRMSNWTADHFAATAGGEGQFGSPGSMGSSGSVSSFQSMLSPQLVQLPLQLANEALEESRGALALVAEAQRKLGADVDAAVASATSSGRDLTMMVSSPGGGVGARSARSAGSAGLMGMGKTAGYFFFWYLCTLCNDKFRINNKASILARFPAPHLLQAFGFGFQVFFVYEVHKHKFQFLAPPPDHLTWTSNMKIVIPIAIAASFDIALELNSGGADDQFNKLCKSGTPLFILMIEHIYSFENPTFKLTASIASITTGSLLTIAKALDYNYELPDVLALTTGASLSALRWAGAEYLLQKQDKGSPIVTMGRLAPWMTICTFLFSIAFEKSWLMITQIGYFFNSPIDMLEGFGQLLMFYVMWTMEMLADFLLISKTSAIAFIVVKTLKTVGDLGGKILMKGLYHEERRWIEREKTMNEETVGLYYIVFGLIIFLWDRYQEWSQGRGAIATEGSKGNSNNGYGGAMEASSRNNNNNSFADAIEGGQRNSNSKRNSNSRSGGARDGGGGKQNSTNKDASVGKDKSGGSQSKGNNSREARLGAGEEGGGECGRRRAGGEECGATGCDGGNACRAASKAEECTLPSASAGASQQHQHQCSADGSQDLLSNCQCFHDIF